MRNFHNVRVTHLVRKPNPNNAYMGKVLVDSKEVHGVKSVNFKCAVDEIPKFTLEMFGMPDIDMHGQVLFSFTPKTVEDAAKVLQNEFKTNPESYKALVSSIKSALKEVSSDIYEISNSAVAELVVKRIIGLE